MKNPKKKNYHTRLREDIEFVFQQIIEFNDSIPQKGFPRPVMRHTEHYGSLPHPNGGWVTCGLDAGLRMLDIVEEHLPKIKEGKQIEIYSVYDAFRKEIGDRFMLQPSKILASEVDKALAQAVKVAKRERKTITHWIPCHLVANTEPRSINVGPVTIQRTSDLFQSQIFDFEKYLAEIGSDKAQNGLDDDDVDQADLEKKGHELVEAARQYYEQFDWVAQVTITDFAPRLSAQRADLCVRVFLNFFRLRLGRRFGRNIASEGGGITAPDAVRITTMANGDLDITLSSSLSVVEIVHEDWHEFAIGIAQESLELPALLLNILTVADNPPPLCQRLLDALDWFGQAVAETSPGAAITKYVCSIERITQCEGKDDDGSVTKKFYERATALSLLNNKTDIHDQVEEFKELYRVRSRLTHGAISPLHPTARMGVRQAEKLAKQVIIGAVSFYTSLDVLLNKWNPASLDEEMEKLVQKGRNEP